MSDEVKPVQTTSDVPAEYGYTDPPQTPSVDLDAAAPETPEPPAAKTAEPSSEPFYRHPRRLVAAAQDHGIPDSEIDSTPTDELDAKVYRLERQRARDERASLLSELNNRASSPPQQPPASAPESEFDPFDADNPRDAFTLPHQKMADEIRALRRKLQELEGGHKQVVEHLGRQRAESEAQFIDRLFNDSNRPEAFGEGSWGSHLTPAQKTARMDALDVARARASRDQSKPFQKHFAEVIAERFPAQAAAPAATPREQEVLKNRIRDYQEGAGTKPTTRTSPEAPYGRARAIKALTKELNGQTHEESDFKI